MTARQSRPRQPRQLDAGDLQPEISSFRLHLAAEGKAPSTVRTYTAQRRDAAMIAVLRAAGIRLSDLAGIRHDPGDSWHGDVDLWLREITVCGKGREIRTVKVSHDADRALDRYLRVRVRHAQAWRR